MRVLRLCSVFEAPAPPRSRGRGFDAVGGMQVHTARLTEALSERGVEQTVVTAYRPGAPRSERLDERTRVIRVGVHATALRQLYGVAAGPAAVRAARGVDLVHAHLGEDLAVLPIARMAAARARAPLAITIHCSLRHTLDRIDARSALLGLLGGAVERRAEAAAGGVFVLSERMAGLLEGSGADRSRIHVVPLGVDLAAFRRPHPRPSELGHGRWIVFVGRLVRAKGVRDLLTAFARVRSADVGLCFVGDGPERRRLESAAAELGVADRVRFAGTVPHARVPAILQHAELLVLPSWYEELGRALVEAMAADVPIVATAVGGIPSIVDDGAAALLVPPRDPWALAGAIDDALDHPELAASLCAAGRAVAERHDIGALAERTLDGYRAILAGTRAAVATEVEVAPWA